MAANAAPFAIGSSGLAINAAVYNANINRQWMINGAAWRLGKAGAALATPSRQTLVTTLSGGLPTGTLNTTAIADNFLVYGVCRAGQVALALGDFVLVQTSGYTETISSAAIAAGAVLATSATAGQVVTGAAGVGGHFAIALEAAAGAGEFVGSRLINLI